MLFRSQIAARSGCQPQTMLAVFVSHVTICEMNMIRRYRSPTSSLATAWRRRQIPQGPERRWELEGHRHRQHRKCLTGDCLALVGRPACSSCKDTTCPFGPSLHCRPAGELLFVVGNSYLALRAASATGWAAGHRSDRQRQVRRCHRRSGPSGRGRVPLAMANAQRPPRDITLIDTLDRKHRTVFDGPCFRAVGDGRDPLLGSRSGGRWDDGTFDLLYTSVAPEGATAEIHFISAKVNLFSQNAIVFTDRSTPRSLAQLKDHGLIDWDTWRGRNAKKAQSFP